MKIGDRVKVARQTVQFRNLLNRLDPSFVDGRTDGEGSIIGFVGSGDSDLLLVRIGANIGAYVDEEVSEADSVQDETNYDSIPQHALDDAIVEEVMRMGSSVNNEGRASQIRFLKERGWSEEDLASMSSKLSSKPKPKRK